MCKRLKYKEDIFVSQFQKILRVKRCVCVCVCKKERKKKEKKESESK